MSAHGRGQRVERWGPHGTVRAEGMNRLIPALIIGGQPIPARAARGQKRRRMGRRDRPLGREPAAGGVDPEARDRWRSARCHGVSPCPWGLTHRLRYPSSDDNMDCLVKTNGIAPRQGAMSAVIEHDESLSMGRGHNGLQTLPKAKSPLLVHDQATFLGITRCASHAQP
jgi:hypothetical protein